MAFDSEMGQEMIRRYKQTGDLELRNEIAIHYSPVVTYIASAMRNIYTKFADFDDIVNEGFITLIGAIEQFDLSKKVKFETFASIKLRGAVIDYVRKHDWIPRSSRHMAKLIEEMSAKLSSELGRAATDAEIAQGLNITEQRYYQALSDVNASFTLSYEQLLFETEFDLADDLGDGVTQAERQLFLEELKGVMAEQIDRLTEKERLVVSLFYYEQLKFSDIAKILEISPSRVSQLHSQALLKLKSVIVKYQSGNS